MKISNKTLLIGGGIGVVVLAVFLTLNGYTLSGSFESTDAASFEYNQCIKTTKLRFSTLCPGLPPGICHATTGCRQTWVVKPFIPLACIPSDNDAKKICDELLGKSSKKPKVTVGLSSNIGGSWSGNTLTVKRGANVTLSWTSQNANACELVYKPAGGKEVKENLNSTSGSRSGIADKTNYKYTVNCGNDNGFGSDTK